MASTLLEGSTSTSSTPCIIMYTHIYSCPLILHITLDAVQLLINHAQTVVRQTRDDDDDGDGEEAVHGS